MLFKALCSFLHDPGTRSEPVVICKEDLCSYAANHAVTGRKARARPTTLSAFIFLESIFRHNKKAEREERVLGLRAGFLTLSAKSFKCKAKTC